MGTVIYNLLSKTVEIRVRDGRNYSKISTRALRTGDGCPGKRQCKVPWQQERVRGLMALMRRLLLPGRPLLIETGTSLGKAVMPGVAKSFFSQKAAKAETGAARRRGGG